MANSPPRIAGLPVKPARWPGVAGPEEQAAAVVFPAPAATSNVNGVPLPVRAA
ncbi:hypothetical protein ACWEVP_21205 [Amycolatopsis sp. NPDC003865]